MLGKLLKYEFKSTGRVMLPLYLVLFVLAIVNGFSYKLNILNPRNLPSLGNYIQIFTTFAFFAIIVSIMVITFFNIVTRFYKNLLGEEGYLMFTLPVKVSSLVTSKVVFAVIWSMASFLVIFICAGVVAAIGANISFYTIIKETIEFLLLASKEAPFNIYFAGIMIFLTVIVSSLFGLMTMYLAMAIGHLRNKNRIMTSIGAYIGLSIMIQFGVIVTINTISYLGSEGVFNFVENLSVNMEMLVVSGSFVVYLSALCYVCHKIICTILERKLNLE